MWPFSRKDKDEIKSIITFTDEEEISIKMMFDLMKDYAIRNEVLNEFEMGMTAKGLSNYAENQIYMAQYKSKDDKEAQDRAVKAIIAVKKAYKIHPLPIYIYEQAKYLDLFPNMKDQSKELFNEFVKAQLRFKPAELDNIFMQGEDTNKLLEIAQDKILAN